jgi:hypothetical protein
MSDSEINKDLKEKAEVLNYMVKMNLEDIEKVGNVMSYYYSDRAYLKKMIASKKPV